MGKEEVKLISFEVDNDQPVLCIRTENRSNRFIVRGKIDRSGEDRGSLVL